MNRRLPAVSMMLLLGAFGVARAQSIHAAPQWRLAPTPRVSIGVADGDERFMFNELVGAVTTRAGHIVVADGQPPLTMVDAAGKFVRQLSGRGNGPGELRYVIDPPFAYRGDSIAIWSPSQRRLSVFDSSGKHGRDAIVMIPRIFFGPNMIPSESCCRMRYAYADGSLLLAFPALIPNQPGPNRHASVALVRISADGARADTLGKFDDRIHRYDASAPNRVRDLRLSLGFMYTMVGDTIVGGNAEGQWLLRITPGGRPDTMRLAGTVVPVTDALKEQYAQALRDARGANPARPEVPGESEYAPSAPAYTRVIADRAGNIWLGQWKLPFSKAPWTFHVYSSRGRPVARIDLPALVNVAYIATDHIALIEADDAGVNYLRIYDILRR